MSFTYIGLMLTIKKVFTFLSTLPVWEQGITLVAFKTNYSKLFLQMMAQVYSVTGHKLKGKGRPFLNAKA